jgi:DNA-directed RNA polymerase subunit H (RpoH/RPB5)
MNINIMYYIYNKMIASMLNNVKEMLIDRNDNIDNLTSINTNDLNIPIVLYSENTCIIIALTTTAKKSIIDQLKQNKKTKDTEDEVDVFKEFVNTYNKFLNYIVIFDELTSADNKLLINFDKTLNKIDGLLSFFLYSDIHFNPTRHHLVDKHTKLTRDEGKELLLQYGLKTKLALPIILKSDPISRWLGIRPGDIVRIERYNLNSGLTYYYRSCV